MDKTGQIEVISVRDPALDVSGMPRGFMFDYAEKRDLAMLAPYITPNRAPTIYTLREMKIAEWKFVMKQPTEIERQLAAFQVAFVRVDNWRKKDGSVVSKGIEEFARYDNGILRDDELEDFHKWDLIEIGDVAYMHSFFQGETERIYRLPPTLLEHWAEHLAHRAAQSKASPAQSSAAA